MNRPHPTLGFWILALVLAGLSGCAGGGPVRVTDARSIPWVDLRSEPDFHSGRPVDALPVEVARLDRVLRTRTLYREPGIAFGHLMLGPGALYPYHAHAMPEAYHVLSGEAEWTVDGETRRVGPGTTIYHAPYADHRWVTVSSQPLRVVWAQWAPDGDRSGLVADSVRRRGGSTTGAFFDAEQRSRAVLPTQLVAPVVEAVPGTVVDSMRRERLAARAAEPSRPPIREFVDSFGVPWNTEQAGVRWRAVFGTPDFEWGHVEIRGPGQRELPPSAAPWMLHVLSGRARARIADGGDLPVAAGTTLIVRPGEPLEVEFDAGTGEVWQDAAPLRGIFLRWAPEGDPDYWARDYFLVEPMPSPPAGSALDRGTAFFPIPGL